VVDGLSTCTSPEVIVWSTARRQSALPVPPAFLQPVKCWLRESSKTWQSQLGSTPPAEGFHRKACVIT